MKHSTSNKHASTRSKIDGQITASRNLIKLGSVFNAITNMTSRAADAAKKGDSRKVLKELALVQRAQAKIARVVQHNTKVTSTIGGMALDYTYCTRNAGGRKAKHVASWHQES
jgi:hypothetical protein